MKFIISSYSCDNAPGNMEKDHILYERCVENNDCYARFYGWDGPSITLGFSQSSKINRCSSFGYSVAVRPTGGQAVLHGFGLTVALAVPVSFFNEDVYSARRSLAGYFIRLFKPWISEFMLYSDKRNAHTYKNNQQEGVCFSSLSSPENLQGPEKRMGIAGLIRKGVYLAQIEITHPSSQSILGSILSSHDSHGFVHKPSPILSSAIQMNSAQFFIDRLAPCSLQTA